MTHVSQLSITNPESTDIRCGYPSKRCENMRVAKRNGELHRFCEHHRLVANRNQQRLQQRRRMQRRHSSSSSLARYTQQVYMNQLCGDYGVQTSPRETHSSRQQQSASFESEVELPVDLDDDDDDLQALLGELLHDKSCVW